MSQVLDIIKKEEERQNNNIELIASENFVSDAVREAVGSVLTNKYAEGYPNDRYSGKEGRYYGGCEHIDELEEYCCAKWREVFRTDYHVNVQPHSGAQANMAAYASILNYGDTILSMDLSAGGHLTHSSPANFVSKLYNVITYGLDDNGFIDYDDIYHKIITHRPKLILAGASAYSREIDFKRIKNIIDSAKEQIAFENIQNQNFDIDGNCITPDFEDYNPYFMVDMAHIAGLVAAEQHQSPFGLADVITTTTHKTLRGPRGGMIFCKPALAKKVDYAIFPYLQGGPLEHVIAGKAVAAEEACTPEYKQYIKQVISNCKAMSDAFKSLGYKVVSGGTDNHLFLLDLTGKNITGARLQELCDAHGITLNKNCVPNDPLGVRETSGVRIGTAAMTTKGWKELDFIKCAFEIHNIIKGD